MAQLHEELVLQVQGRLLKETCWLVVDSHSPDVRWEWAEKNLSNRTQQDSKKQGNFGNPKDRKLQDHSEYCRPSGPRSPRPHSWEGKTAYCLLPWLLKPVTISQGMTAAMQHSSRCCSSQNTWRADGYPRPAYLIHQFSARSSRIALVTHRFRWDRRPKNFSYLQRCLEDQQVAMG